MPLCPTPCLPHHASFPTTHNHPPLTRSPEPPHKRPSPHLTLYLHPPGDMPPHPSTPCSQAHTWLPLRPGSGPLARVRFSSGGGVSGVGGAKYAAAPQPDSLMTPSHGPQGFGWGRTHDSAVGGGGGLHGGGGGGRVDSLPVWPWPVSLEEAGRAGGEGGCGGGGADDTLGLVLTRRVACGASSHCAGGCVGGGVG